MFSKKSLQSDLYRIHEKKIKLQLQIEALEVKKKQHLKNIKEIEEKIHELTLQIKALKS